MIEHPRIPSSEKTLAYLLCAEYTKRYQDILFRLPSAVFQRGTTIEQGSSRFSDMEGPLRAYIDLCAEELFVHEAGVIPENVWVNWAAGIRAMFNVPAIKGLWAKVCDELRYVDLKRFLASPPSAGEADASLVPQQ